MCWIFIGRFLLNLEFLKNQTQKSPNKKFIWYEDNNYINKKILYYIIQRDYFLNYLWKIIFKSQIRNKFEEKYLEKKLLFRKYFKRIISWLTSNKINF